MKKEDRDEMAQFVKMKKHQGRRASKKRIEIDFIRKHFGKECAVDALKRPRAFFDERFYPCKKGESSMEFSEEIEDFPKETKIVALLLYCGFTLKQLVNIFEVNHRTIKRILRGEAGKSIFS